MATVNGSAGSGVKPHFLEPFPSLQRFPTGEKLDAGLRSLDHYRTRLPSWRYLSRQRLIPLVRWETPYIANIQKSIRSPALDTYFSVTANLGTHTFYMIFLPILFWCGQTSIARAMVTILAAGVFFSGVLKDMWCLPRPLSPPLHRISMSKSTVLEYGFPSTHSTNAVSVAVYILFVIRANGDALDPTLRVGLQILTTFYATSIVLGRVYCGMHGFLDIIVGSALGAVISTLQFQFGEEFDAFIYTGGPKTLAIAILTVLLLVRLHPEPADDCPCFDDSVAFAGVVVGMFIASWHFTRTAIAWNHVALAAVPYDFQTLGFPKTFSRILMGTFLIVIWRELMKPALLSVLPPLFRVIEDMGLTHARRFFLQASDYNKVPGQLKDAEVIPSVSKIPGFLTKLAHPRKSRSVSVGPQSAADAFEALAYRDNQRRQSKSEDSKPDYFAQTSSVSRPRRPIDKFTSSDLYRAMNAPEIALYTPSEAGDGTLSSVNSRAPSQERIQDEKEEREMFQRLEKPRVRYDVEVVTKLIVYIGIAWIAMEGCPLLFEYLGLGMSEYKFG